MIWIDVVLFIDLPELFWKMKNIEEGIILSWLFDHLVKNVAG